VGVEGRTDQLVVIGQHLRVNVVSETAQESG
jgi:hypothetical protein